LPGQKKKQSEKGQKQMKTVTKICQNQGDFSDHRSVQRSIDRLTRCPSPFHFVPNCWQHFLTFIVAVTGRRIAEDYVSFPRSPLINFPAHRKRKWGKWHWQWQWQTEGETKALQKKKNYASPFANKPLQRCSTTAAIFGL